MGYSYIWIRNIKPLLFLIGFFLTGGAFSLYARGSDQVSLAAPLHLNWSFETGALTDFPLAVDEGIIYVPLNGGAIVSLNIVNGELSWRSDVGGVISAAPFADSKGVYIASESVSYAKSSYPQATGALRALSRKSGVTMWMRTLPAPIRAALVSNGSSLFGYTSDGRVYAFKKESGEINWVKYNATSFTSDLLLSGNALYLSDAAGNLYAIDQTTGQTLWRYQTHRSSWSAIAVSAEMIYVGLYDGSVSAINGKTGRLKWRIRTGASVQSVMPAGKCVVATSLDNFVYCLSPARGDKIWKRQLAGRVTANPLISGDYVLLSPLAGEECVVLNLVDGKKTNSIYVGEENNMGAPPIIYKNLILLPTRKGLLAFTNSLDKPDAAMSP